MFAVFSAPLGPLPPLGSLLDPTTGLWSLAFGNRALQTQTIEVAGLSAPAVIVRDMSGVPHIYAKDPADGWFALGYAHAEDRLWQMDIQYRTAAGRLSEVLGPSALSSDEFFRTIGLARIASAAAAAREQANGTDETVIRAYTAGVNAYIAGLDPPDYPLEFKLLGYKPELWTPTKSLAEGALIAWGLMGSFSDLDYNLLVGKFGASQAAELFPRYPAGNQTPIQPAALPGGTDLISPAAAKDILAKAAAADRWTPNFEDIGSNNWAVLGNRTATGKPLLDADPHLRLQLPSLWYQAELQAPPFSVRGATFPGVPAFFFGTNGNIAWGETNTGADVNDFFVEHLSPNGTQYLYGGTWHDLTVYDEPIQVKGAAPVDFHVKATVHGPILTQEGDNVSLMSTITLFGDELEAMLGIDLATNSDQFNASAQYWRVPAQNIIYADAKGRYGNVGVRSTGWYPIRGNFSGRLPVDGSNASYGWIGWVPFASYPHLWDPPQGYVSSNNQVPYPVGYPYADSLGSFFDPGYRSRRINELLAGNAQVSRSDMERYQLDVLDTAAQSLVPYLLRAVKPADGVAQLAYNLLSVWDYTMNQSSAAASIWYTFMGHYVSDTFADEYAAKNASDLPFPQFNTLENLTIRDPTSTWFNNVSAGTVHVQTRDDVIRQAFNDTVSDLAGRLGSTPASWTWGSIHFREFDHLTGLAALRRGPVSAPGDDYTLNVAGGLVATAGPSWRQVIDFSTVDNSRAIYPGGQSDNPLSVHYDDFLLGSYNAGRYLAFRGYPTADTIPTDFVESTITLTPD